MKTPLETRWLPRFLSFAVLSALLFTPASGAPADDRDGDGVVDVVDNCTLRPNPEQRDTDRDGIGDACDADYDQNGVVDEKDHKAITRFMGISKHEPAFDRRYDHDGDGTIGPKDLKVLNDTKGKPPGPFADSDGDGVGVADDWCPGGLPTRPRPNVGHGCSLFDVAARPRTFLEPLKADTQALSNDLTGAEALRGHDATSPLDRVMEGIDSALGLAVDGDFCGAARIGAIAGAEYEEAVAAIDAARQELLRLGPPAPPVVEVPIPNAGDTREWDSELAMLDYWTRRVERQAQKQTDAVELLEASCNETRAFTGVTGRVKTIDWSRRQVELQDGRVFAIGEGFEMQTAPGTRYEEWGEGDDVTFDGIYSSEDDRTGVVSAGGPTREPALQDGNHDAAACIQFRIAPFQRFTDPAQIELHQPEGYLANGKYRIEAGARLAAERLCALPSANATQWLKYTMRIDFVGSGADLMLATGFTPEHAPIPVPNRATGTITVTTHTQKCSRNTGNVGQAAALCGPKEVFSTREYPITLRQAFQGCVTLLGRGSNRVYAVDDRSANDFEVDYLAGFVLTGDHQYDAGTQPVYEAEGYYVGNNGQNPSSFPTVNKINVFDWFALHNTDFYPIFEPTSDLEKVALFESLGVNKASGLRWPHIRGQLNGRPYRYACGVPPVVRDAVNLCPGVDYTSGNGLDHAFYRLPFAEGDEEWGQGQGNDGGFTHSGGFAYDMVAPLDQTILVARAGRVEALKESATQQCDARDDSDDDTCPAGNYLYVKHQDGTVGQYVHMPHNGVVPEEGDIVLRGDEVGPVGVTGNTTGPHLHFAARSSISGSGKLALFEAVDPDDETELLTCYEPPDRTNMSLVPLRSNNVPR